MAGVRTKTVKRAAKELIEKHFSKLTHDFHTNKRVCQSIAVIPSKRLRNKIAGFVTHLMRRMQKGPIRGISTKLQEEQREIRDNYVPSKSALDKSQDFDAETFQLLEHLGYPEPKWANQSKYKNVGFSQ
uniref:Small ribosomal subunit protein eS17 n=1 Tax=Myxobolus squamalis TaxID=59785 RepID=A0A6B2G4J5_MYXSQ